MPKIPLKKGQLGYDPADLNLIPAIAPHIELVSLTQLVGVWARDPILDAHPSIQMEVDVAIEQGLKPKI